jgi:hypothetical protein
MSNNAKKPIARKAFSNALEHFSYYARTFAEKIFKEAFRKHILKPALKHLGVEILKPYDYFCHQEEKGLALAFSKAVFDNHIFYTATSYSYDYMYDWAVNISTSQPIRYFPVINSSDEFSLMWVADRVALPFVLSRFNADPGGNLMESHPEQASSLLTIFAMAKTAKAGIEHISYQIDNLLESYHNYQQDNSVNNFNPLFYSGVDFFGSLLTSALAFTFTCAIQNSLHQNNNQYTKIAASFVADYKVQNTAMFIAQTTVEFLVKLPINGIYDFLYPGVEDNEVKTVQVQYPTQTLSASTDATDLATHSFSKELTVYSPNINAVSMAVFMYGLASSNKQSDYDVFLKINIAQDIFHKMMQTSAFDHSEIWLPEFDSTSMKIIDVSGSVCLPQDE